MLRLPPWPYRVEPWLHPLVIVGSAVHLLWATWGTWPDPIVDSGQQLYLPWRVAAGERLYADLAFYNGPLSQAYHGVLFRFFGAGVWTLVASNLLVIAAVLALLHGLTRRVAGRWPATAACLGFVWLFAFARFIEIGNYNWAFPYSHELTHGVLLSLAALAALSRLPSGGAAWAGIAGLALGAALLTKAEAAVAGLGAGAVGTALGLRDLPERRARIRAAAAFAAGLAAPSLVAFVGFAAGRGPRDALAGTLAAWAVAARPEVTELPFFRESMGLARPAAAAMALARATGGLLGVLAAAAAAAIAAGRRLRRRGRIVAGLAAAGIAASLAFGPAAIPIDAARALPAVVLAGIVWAIRGFRRRDAAVEDRSRFASILVLFVFAGLLLLKIGLNCRIEHYGFALAMPAAALGIVAVVGWIPGWIVARRGSAGVFLAVVLPVLLAGAASHQRTQAGILRGVREPLGEGADAFVGDGRARIVRAAVEEIRARAGPGETVAVFPEGAIVNYLSRRASSIPYIHFMPPEVRFYGEERIVEALSARPPDWVVVIPKDLTEWGQPPFGSGFGDRIARWVDARYAVVTRREFPEIRGVLLVARRRAQ